MFHFQTARVANTDSENKHRKQNILISKQHARKGKRGRETDIQTETLRETDRETETESERLHKEVKINMKDQPYVAAMAVEQWEAQAVAGS